MRAFAMLPLLMLAACATTASPPPALEGTRWRLTSADGGPLALPEAQQVTAEFSADRIAGYGGCNQYSGSYTREGDTLTIAPVVATKRGCMGPGNEIEQAWFALLAEPVQVARDGDALVLRGGGAVLRFVPAGSG